MSIRQKLTIILLTVGLIPTCLTSIIAYTVIEKQLTDKSVEQIKTITAKQEQRLSSLLQSKQEEVIRLANVRVELNTALSQYLTSRQDRDLRAVITLLRERKLEVPLVQSIYITDRQGGIIASTLNSNVGKKLDPQYIYVRPTETSTIRMLEDTSDGAKKIYITSPMIADKKEVGVLVFTFKLDDLIATVNDYTGLGESGETVVASIENDQATSLFPLRFESEGALKTKLNNLHLQNQNRTVHTTNSTDYRGKDVIIGTGFIESAQWAVGVKIDTSEVLAPITTLRNTVISIFIASAIVIIFIAFYFTRYFTRSLIMLTEKAQQIRLGNLQQRIEVKSKDEVGVLASTFNEMAQNLVESYGVLERKVAERTKALDQKLDELEDAKAKDEAILDSIGDGLVVSDDQGKILLINNIAADLLNIDQKKLQGKNLVVNYELYDETETLLPAEDRPVRTALQTGHKVIQSVKVIEGKTKRALSITASPVTQQGRTIGAIQIIRDITKEKEIDRMKTEFISIASHQLRTPLSAIKWFTEMLLSGDAGKLKKEQIEFAKNISDSTERMIELVSSLLNISRIESGRIIVDPQPTDLHELVTGIINDLKGKTEEKKQTMIISVHKDLPKINLDPHLIGQVYLNLLTNAIKYTPAQGEVSVIISRKENEVISQISDTGYGIPKSEQAKMFQKFFRATNIVKVESDGTGLGMYLVKSIIESSGGKIWFESEEGKGTTFWFSIPLSGMKAKKGEVTLGD